MTIITGTAAGAYAREMAPLRCARQVVVAVMRAHLRKSGETGSCCLVATDDQEPNRSEAAASIPPDVSRHWHAGAPPVVKNTSCPSHAFTAAASGTALSIGVRATCPSLTTTACRAPSSCNQMTCSGMRSLSASTHRTPELTASGFSTTIVATSPACWVLRCFSVFGNGGRLLSRPLQARLMPAPLQNLLTTYFDVGAMGSHCGG